MVSPEQARARTAPLRDPAAGEARLLALVLAALGAVVREDKPRVTLDRDEARAVLVHVQELRRDLGAARAQVEREKARTEPVHADELSELAEQIERVLQLGPQSTHAIEAALHWRHGKSGLPLAYLARNGRVVRAARQRWRLA